MNIIASANVATTTRPHPRAEVRATLNFIRRQAAKPVFHSAALTGGLPKTFFETEAHAVAIADMREVADTLTGRLA